MKTGFYFKLHLLLESLGNTTWLSEFISSSTLYFKLQLVCLFLGTETFCSVPRRLKKFTCKSTKILICLHLRTDLNTSYSHECMYVCMCMNVCVCVFVLVCVHMHAYKHQNGPHLKMTSVDRNESQIIFVCVHYNKLRM